jgi:hypothetical protein
VAALLQAWPVRPAVPHWLMRRHGIDYRLWVGRPPRSSLLTSDVADLPCLASWVAAS